MMMISRSRLNCHNPYEKRNFFFFLEAQPLDIGPGIIVDICLYTMHAQEPQVAIIKEGKLV